jgi:cyanophycinase
MNGYLLLEGGAEFGGQMSLPDLKALELAGGLNAPVRIIPTAAAPDHNDGRAGQNGVRWFRTLGATNVESLKLIDKPSANSPLLAKAVRDAKLIYLLGGFTHYLGQTLKDSACWQAALDAFQNGAVIAGSSAGAMVMCRYYFNPGRDDVFEGLNLIPNALVLPHHNTFGKGWAARLSALMPDVTLLGIDERTGMLSNSAATEWSVLGAGQVTIYRDGKPEIHPAGQQFGLK